MTAQDIQSLIAEIDRALAGESSDSDGSTLTIETPPAQILEKVRSYLASVRDRLEVPPPFLAEAEPTQLWQNQIANAIASAVIEQMNCQRAEWMQPWQMELETVRQQRSALLRDIQQLEGQRQQLVGDFLQVLLNRTSEHLKQEIAQTLERIETQALYSQQLSERPGGGERSALPQTPTQRLEQLQQLQVQSDRLLMSLDSTFRHVFETLEKDLQSYEESLSAAIARMYDLGRQGESILESRVRGTTPLDDLAPQSAGAEERTPVQTEPDKTPLKPLELGQTQPPPIQLPDSAQFFPFPGIEIPPSDSEVLPSSSREEEETARVDIEAMDDSEIDALLQIDRDDERAIAQETEQDRVLDRWGQLPPAETEDGEAAELSDRLFGGLSDPALSAGETDRAVQFPVNWERQNVSLETGLFSSAPAQAAVGTVQETSVQPEASASQPMPDEDETPPNLADTITSLTELLEQAFSEPESETETYSAVPPGETLMAVDEAKLQQEPIAEQALDDPQLNQRLDEDLQRFGCENSESGAPESAEVTAEALAESDAPPAELLGENLGEIDLEDLWSESAEESKTAESGEAENLALPDEIETDPWSQPASRADPEPDSEDVENWDDISQNPEK